MKYKRIEELKRKLGLKKDIKELYNSRKIDLYDDEIKIIPKELSELVNLQELYLSDNRIKEIPEGLLKVVNF